MEETGGGQNECQALFLGSLHMCTGARENMLDSTVSLFWPCALKKINARAASAGCFLDS